MGAKKTPLGERRSLQESGLFERPVLSTDQS